MSVLQVGGNANIIATGGSFHPIPRAKWPPPSRPFKRLNVSKGPDKWSQCKQSHVNKCISDLCRLVMPNMPSAPFLMMSRIFSCMSQASRRWPCLCRLRHASFDTFGKFLKNFRPIENQWHLCFSRLSGSKRKKSHFDVVGHMSQAWECTVNLLWFLVGSGYSGKLSLFT